MSDAHQLFDKVFTLEHLDQGHSSNLRPVVNDLLCHEATSQWLLSSLVVSRVMPTHKARQFVASGQMKQIICPEADYASNMAAIVKKSSSTGRRLNLFLKLLREVHGITTDKTVDA